ncbi:YdcF family protein [Burkholderia pseudomultivorans]|uniref:YdcF family protein n=1 Tax=Burkholderia pseudomultivorans TaxID=1207504 RepID=UPI00188F2D97|nr:YdcF family protein [Burkholderia pseudomultivorans]MBF5014293.1 YdcF family protein [Burkholderia pseudomultivorans]
MILFDSFVLLFIGFMLFRKWRRLIALAAVALFGLLATGWLAAPLIAWAEAGVVPVARPDMHGQTTLIVIGAGTRRTDTGLRPPPDGDARIRTTAALYRACRQQAQRCTVVMSGGDPQHHGETEAAVYGRQLVAAGVDSGDLILEPDSRTTYENAKFTASILRSRHDDARILVTSSYQMRRALLDFRRFGIDPQPVYANRRDAQTGWLPRWRNIVNAEQALHELVGIAQFHVYRLLGWF